MIEFFKEATGLALIGWGVASVIASWVLMVISTSAAQMVAANGNVFGAVLSGASAIFFGIIGIHGSLLVILIGVIKLVMLIFV